MMVLYTFFEIINLSVFILFITLVASLLSSLYSIYVEIYKIQKHNVGLTFFNAINKEKVRKTIQKYFLLLSILALVLITLYFNLNGLSMILRNESEVFIIFFLSLGMYWLIILCIKEILKNKIYTTYYELFDDSIIWLFDLLFFSFSLCLYILLSWNLISGQTNELNIDHFYGFLGIFMTFLFLSVTTVSILTSKKNVEQTLSQTQLQTEIDFCINQINQYYRPLNSHFEHVKFELRTFYLKVKSIDIQNPDHFIQIMEFINKEIRLPFIEVNFNNHLIDECNVNNAITQTNTEIIEDMLNFVDAKFDLMNDNSFETRLFEIVNLIIAYFNTELKINEVKHFTTLEDDENALIDEIEFSFGPLAYLNRESTDEIFDIFNSYNINPEHFELLKWHIFSSIYIQEILGLCVSFQENEIKMAVYAINSNIAKRQNILYTLTSED